MAGGSTTKKTDKKSRGEKPVETQTTKDSSVMAEPKQPTAEVIELKGSSIINNSLNKPQDNLISTEIIDKILEENRKQQIPEIGLIYDLIFEPLPYKKLHDLIKTLEAKREKFEHTIGELADVNQQNKSWDVVADKICKLYVMATDVGLTAWGASNSENSAPRFTAEQGMDWQLRHLQDLTFRVLSKTAGLDWKGLQNSYHAVHVLRSDLSKLIKDLPRTIDLEFREKVGNTLEGFAENWKKFQEDLDHVQTTLKNVLENQVENFFSFK